jgi:hypothetical protein
MSNLSLEKFGENLPASGVIAFSQAAIGLGAGLLAADRMGQSARRTTSAILLGAGVAALIPVVIGIASRISHRPGSRRSMSRRLESIRSDSGLTDEETF